MNQEPTHHQEEERLTSLIGIAAGGDRDAQAVVLEIVMNELRRIATKHLRERPCRELRETSLIDDAYGKLFGPNNHLACEHRGHFFYCAKRAMDQLMIDEFRRLKNKPTPEQLIDTPDKSNDPLFGMYLDEIIEELEARDPRQARAFVLWLKGWKIKQIAVELDVAYSTAKEDLTLAKARARKYLGG